MGKIRKSRKIVITVFLILTVVATGIAAFGDFYEKVDRWLDGLPWLIHAVTTDTFDLYFLAKCFH